MNQLIHCGLIMLIVVSDLVMKFTKTGQVTSQLFFILLFVETASQKMKGCELFTDVFCFCLFVAFLFALVSLYVLCHK